VPSLFLPVGQSLFEEIQNKKDEDWQKRRALREQNKLEAEQKTGLNQPKPF
jgi:hypothetical protein